jgi:hypothetical protein
VFDDNGQSFANKITPGDEIMKTLEFLKFIDVS